MSRLLFKETPILVLPMLASKIGLNETIFLQQLHYWLKESKHTYEGHKWVYNTYEGWREQFPFWSVSTIRRIITKLEQEEYIITGNYNRLKLDKTKWYRINYEALNALHHVEEMTSPAAQIEKAMNTPTLQNEQHENLECAALITNMNRPIPENSSEKKKVIIKASLVVESPYQFFEQNGFGTIGNYITSKISTWCAQLSESLVIEAMKLAVENGSKNWKYIEAILMDWRRKGYTTVEEVVTAQRLFKERKSKKKTPQYPASGRDVPAEFQLNLSAGEDET